MKVIIINCDVRLAIFTRRRTQSYKSFSAKITPEFCSARVLDWEFPIKIFGMAKFQHNLHLIFIGLGPGLDCRVVNGIDNYLTGL